MEALEKMEDSKKLNGPEKDDTNSLNSELLEDSIDDSKRAFLKKSLTVGAIGISGLGTAYGFYSSRKGPSVISQVVYIESLPDEFENFTIAQISDLHVGPTIKINYDAFVL